MGHVNELPCNMIIIQEPMCLSFERSGSNTKNLSGPRPACATNRDEGEKIDIHGKLGSQDPVWNTTYQHAVYVADIADPFILGLDFLKGMVHSRLQQERITFHTRRSPIFKIDTGQNPIRQVTANENITISRTEIIVPGYIGNDESFNSG
ncbi:hypothetical protein TNCV_2636221 [Trichonephila clavipes]|nr:hypothetical protein TNCV_2636221 [Trichonephila clavipes]